MRRTISNWSLDPLSICGPVAIVVCVVAALLLARRQTSIAAPPPERPQLDPAAWGDDHAGEEVPLYVEGGECLFCHRNDVGEDWADDKHNLTIRDVEAESPPVEALARADTTSPFVEQLELILGDDRQNAFLRRSDAYGQVELLTVRANKGRGRRWRLHGDIDAPQWDTEIFAQQCSGCHATGVDSSDGTFITVAHDCYVCHGDGPLEHANEPELMPLAAAREDAPREIAGICGQCHIRFGRSRTSGRPYPNTFVAGDNLFRDFEVDWQRADDPELNPADRHVIDNIREVVLYGNEELTCLSCHQVHGNSTERHRDLPESRQCAHCHEPGGDKKVHRTYEVHSELCGY